MTNSRRFSIAFSPAIFLYAFFAAASAAQATTHYRTAEVRQFQADTAGTFQPTQSFDAYQTSFTGGGTVTAGDLGHDGKPEIVTGPGAGGAPQVRVFRQDGSVISQFNAYDATMTSGVNVAIGDLAGDGSKEIITAPQAGAGPQIRAFNVSGGSAVTTGFYAYDENFHGGVNIAAGDLNCDNKAEIVTGSGVGMVPELKVFSGEGKLLNFDVQPFAADNQGGVSVAVGNVDGGCDQEIIAAIQSQGQAWVKVYKFNADKTVIAQWKAFDDSFTGGVNVAAGDVTGSTNDEIMVGVHSHGGPQVKVFSQTGGEVLPNFMAYESDFDGGVNLVVSNKTIFTLPTKLPPDGRTDVDRYVKVDLSEQRMYVYDHGYQIMSFLISSGVRGKATPTGEFHIFKKIYDHLYSGPGYYLPHTLYNLEFKEHYYLHGAYWHHNFGHPMSHGCVNISYANAKPLYEWMQLGDLVVIQQ